jgi:hypothetical protein
MNYVFDEELNEHVWHSLISWRPPPGTPEDREYDLTVNITDPEGNLLEVSTAAGLIPQITSLPPSRMVMCSTTKDLYLTNLDGANEVHITKNGEEENPFFSADGSRIFSFHDDSALGTRELRSRPADGSVSFLTLASFDNTDNPNIYYDPSYTYAAIVAGNGYGSFPWGYVTTSTDDDGNTTYNVVTGASQAKIAKISILNLMSNDPAMHVTDVAFENELDFQWAHGKRHHFSYKETVPTPLKTWFGSYGPYHLQPGFDKEAVKKKVEGYPPVITTANVNFDSARGRIYNPASPRWYLEVSGNTLKLGNDALAAAVDVKTFPNPIADESTDEGPPTWSADGEHVALITGTGPDTKAVTMKLLNSSQEMLSSFIVNYELASPNLKSAQLSPKGKWVYFLRDQKVFQATNSTGSGPVDISSHIGTDMLGYVVSP